MLTMCSSLLARLRCMLKGEQRCAKRPTLLKYDRKCLTRSAENDNYIVPDICECCILPKIEAPDVVVSGRSGSKLLVLTRGSNHIVMPLR